MTRTPRRVLLIEDDASLRALLNEALTAEGYYVAMLDDGAGAFHSIYAQQPDVVVLDVVMPGVDGLQVLAEMRALGYTVPVLVITGLASQVLPIAGANAMLPKPFDLGEFLATVARLLAGAKE
jgi:two-component system response regulator TctD